jgi:hypothetical protein
VFGGTCAYIALAVVSSTRQERLTQYFGVILSIEGTIVRHLSRDREYLDTRHVVRWHAPQRNLGLPPQPACEKRQNHTESDLKREPDSKPRSTCFPPLPSTIVRRYRISDSGARFSMVIRFSRPPLALDSVSMVKVTFRQLTTPRLAKSMKVRVVERLHIGVG